MRSGRGRNRWSNSPSSQPKELSAPVHNCRVAEAWRPVPAQQSILQQSPKSKRSAAQMLADSRATICPTRAVRVRTVHDADAAVAALGLGSAGVVGCAGADGDDHCDSESDIGFWSLSQPPFADFAIAGEAVRSDTGKSFWQ